MVSLFVFLATVTVSVSGSTFYTVDATVPTLRLGLALLKSFEFTQFLSSECYVCRDVEQREHHRRQRLAEKGCGAC